VLLGFSLNGNPKRVWSAGWPSFSYGSGLRPAWRLRERKVRRYGQNLRRMNPATGLPFPKGQRSGFARQPQLSGDDRVLSTLGSCASDVLTSRRAGLFELPGTSTAISSAIT
jgi:hypothetical protein